MAKILIIENDLFLLTTLIKCLSQQHQVDEASSIKKSLLMIEKHNYDLVITDRVLNDGDGLTVVEKLAETSFHTRVLILSQKGKINDRIEGLRKGADDYLSKPFSLEELNLRVIKLIQKNKNLKTKIYIFNNLKIDVDNGKVWNRNKLIELSKTEMKIFYYLVKFKNRFLSREEIISYVWGDGIDIPSKKSVDVYIARLRSKLGIGHDLILTKHGFGYCAKL